MSDSESNTPSTASASRADVVRKLILFVLLGIMLAALAYDYRVARPAVNAAYDKITDESRRVNADGHAVFTNKDVSKLLGRQPDESFRDAADLVEVYHFAGGVPLKPHKLYTVFKKNGENEIFYRHAKFGYRTSQDVIPIPVPTEIEYSEEEAGQMNEQMIQMGPPGGGGGPGGPGGGPGGGGPGGPGGGLPFDPVSMFDGLDEDDDELLTGDEIPDFMAEDMEALDANQDGSVSKEEMLARLRARQAASAAADNNQGGTPGLTDAEDLGEEDAPQKEKPDPADESATDDDTKN